MIGNTNTYKPHFNLHCIEVGFRCVVWCIDPCQVDRNQYPLVSNSCAGAELLKIQASAVWRLMSESWTEVEKLLKLKPNVDKRDEDGMTTLMYSSFYRNVHCMELLLDNGADPNAVVIPSKTTSLMFAVMSGSSEAVELLLQYGADPNLRNSKDRTARDIAALTGQRVCCNILRPFTEEEYQN
eukprot:gene3882-6372_t